MARSHQELTNKQLYCPYYYCENESDSFNGIGNFKRKILSIRSSDYISMYY